MNGTALRKPTARRVVGMVAGIVIIALGIALFKQSHLGNDSISVLNMRLAELLRHSRGPREPAADLLVFPAGILVGAGPAPRAPLDQTVDLVSRPTITPPALAPARCGRLAWVIAAVLVTALGAGWPCGPWHLDLCVLPWALHPVLRSDVLPEGAAIQTEQLRNPAASNHTLPFLLLPLSRK